MFNLTAVTSATNAELTFYYSHILFSRTTSKALRFFPTLSSLHLCLKRIVHASLFGFAFCLHPPEIKIAEISRFSTTCHHFFHCTLSRSSLGKAL